MSAPTCRSYDECNAPLCPEDMNSLAHCAWFRDEETCRRKDYAGLGWVRRQKKLVRATGRDRECGCFTVEMLAHQCQIRKGITGLDPDAGPITQEQSRRWIAARAVPSRKPPSGRRFSAKNSGESAPPVTSEAFGVLRQGDSP
jgi:hypothetical protein